MAHPRPDDRPGPRGANPLRQLVKKIVKTAPKPKPPVPVRTPVPWDDPGCFTAWDPQPQITKIARAGFKWVAIQVGPNGWNSAAAAQAKQAGLSVVAWGLAPFPAPTADGYILQVEDTDQYTAALDMLHHGDPWVHDKPVAIVTTFGGSDSKNLVDPLTVFTPDALVECYAQDDPIHADLARMMWQAHAYGWPNATPVIGLYGDVRIDAYQSLGRAYSVWLAEEMTDQDWQDVTAHNSVVQS